MAGPSLPQKNDLEDWIHVPVLTPRVGEAPSRLDPALLARFVASSASDVADKVGRLYTMDSGIRPLHGAGGRMAGTALTVRTIPGDNWAIHGALSMIGPDDVLVVDWCGYHDGCGAGVLSLIGPIDNGLRGVVVDGAWRDVDDVAALGLPLFGRGISPHSPAKAAPGEINVPVCCGGVIVEPGDIVVGDGDGVAVVPRRGIEPVLARLPEHQPRESIDQYARDDLRRMTAERGAEYRAAWGLGEAGAPTRD